MLCGLANPKNLKNMKLLSKREAMDTEVTEAMRCMEEERTPGKS